MRLSKLPALSLPQGPHIQLPGLLVPPCYCTQHHPTVYPPVLSASLSSSCFGDSDHLTCHMTQVSVDPPSPEKTLCLFSSAQVSSDPSMYIEVENEVTAVGGVKLSRLKCNREGKEWETVLTSRILTAAGSW